MKRIFIIVVFMVMGFSIQAHAALQTIGTATYNLFEYNLIYDDDSNITWLDYSYGRANWDNQMNWLSELNTSGVLTYNFNSGVTMSWSDDWRLPITFDQSCKDYGCTNSEWGHLYYTELGNIAFPTAGWDQVNTGDFQNWQVGQYRSETEWVSNSTDTWIFDAHGGYQTHDMKAQRYYALAVRSGDISIVPEPISSTLFIVGGATLGFRRFKKKSVT